MPPRCTPLAVLTLAALAVLAGSPQARAATAQPAPDWYAGVTLAGFPDRTLGGAELRGRPVLLQLWASWCGSCGALMWDLDELASRFPGVTYLAVSIDAEPAAPQAYLARHPLFARHPRRFWFDDGAVLQRRLGVSTVPVIVVLDAAGHEVLRHRGHVNGAELQRLRRALAELDPPGDEALQGVVP